MISLNPRHIPIVRDMSFYFGGDRMTEQKKRVTLVDVVYMRNNTTGLLSFIYRIKKTPKKGLSRAELKFHIHIRTEQVTE